ncbi:TonB-dependent receptor domain-containing protein [Pollutimonas harenae]|uniref:TonB-dependent receptor n=1 Tax=Pollutimonas harenae TaxID=657015 RepID=A0A853GYQ3_9BURK|nr:TonB-dependent receptor [Pollutimonas harenae]NYT84195.1 TonB-dependent receptor [Pollutimonas harenae]TEA73389.1 TonB-dependent receptor [Pollutimonas harenae]
MYFTPKRQILAVLSCFVAATAHAQTTPPPQLDNIVVTASRSLQLEKDVIGDVTLINKADLEKEGQNSVAEILAKQPGIQISNNGGPQTATSVFLRGAPSQHTQVLVDGVRINSLTTGVSNWNAIDPALIERIEIVRGASSSLYGSGAIGGVINIITKKGGEDRPLSAWTNIGYGSYDTFKSSVGFSGAQNGWDYALSSSMADSSGFSATNEMAGPYTYDPDADGYSQHALSGSLGYRWAAGQHIGLTAYNGYISGDFDAGPGPIRTLTRQQAYNLTSTNNLTDYWQSILRFGFSKEAIDNRIPGFDSTAGSLQRSYTWQNNFEFLEHQQLSLILERLEERVEGESNYLANRRDTNSAGLVYRGDFDAHHLQASVRNDNITSYGNETTGSLAYNFDLTDNWRIGLAGSTGFQAPTFAYLYAPDTPASFWGPRYQNNPNLKPEKSRNIEASIQYNTDTTRLGLVVYQNKIKDLIVGSVFDPLISANTAQNINRATIRGITLTAEQVVGNTTLRASADFMNPVDDETGDQLIQRAKRVFHLSAEHRLNALRLGAEYQFTSKRYDNDFNTFPAERVTLGGYGLVNLTAAYDFSKNASVHIRWNNLLDKNYANVYGYNTAGSNVFVNLSLRM